MKPLIITALWLVCMACSSNGKAAHETKEGKAPDLSTTPTFSADSAYRYVDTQVKFGPRVPGSTAHARCTDYIVSELQRHGADTVMTQTATVNAYNGDKLPITNVMAQYNRASNYRVLLAAHYDTRPWADSEENATLRSKPIPGANDGASGVGVLLELARNLGKTRPDIGIDLLFVDAEDYGRSEGWGNAEETWCLGTQHWITDIPYTAANMPRYGIVLDMVGGIGARFHREYSSNNLAPAVVDKVWSMAQHSGYGEYFINSVGGAIIDDHVYLNQAGIPSIDIVECNNPTTRSFPPTWHRMSDDMNSIDPATLGAVGQTVTNLIYTEKPRP